MAVEKVTEKKEAYKAASEAWLNNQINMINNTPNSGNFSCSVHVPSECLELGDLLIQAVGSKRKVTDNRPDREDGSKGSGTILFTVEPA